MGGQQDMYTDDATIYLTLPSQACLPTVDHKVGACDKGCIRGGHERNSRCHLLTGAHTLDEHFLAHVLGSCLQGLTLAGRMQGCSFREDWPGADGIHPVHSSWQG